MGPRRARLLAGMLIIGVVTAIGSAWYWLVEDFSLIDAVYQSVITVSTVGFGEVQPLDTSGRLFTIGLIVIGVASVVYALGGFAEMLIDSSIDRVVYRRRERTVERLTGHTIICGYGRFGAAVAARLPDKRQVVVIEAGADRSLQSSVDGFAAIEGDCTLDETLEAAGVVRASKVIVCLSHDSDAISTVLSVRVLNPAIRVVTRVSDAGAAKKLRLAGADHVVSPIEMGAQRLVADALQPSIGSFLDAAVHDETVGLSIRAVPIVSDGVAARHELETATGVRIIGVQSLDGTVHSVGEFDESFVSGQTVLVVGHKDELTALERLVRL